MLSANADTSSAFRDLYQYSTMGGILLGWRSVVVRLNYTAMTSVSSFTAAADFFNAASSSAVNLI